MAFDPFDAMKLSVKNAFSAAKGLLLGGLLCASPGFNLFAQGNENYGNGLKFNVNEDGSKYIRVVLWNQIWIRGIQNNPGTLIAGAPSPTTWDLGARRIRGMAYAQLGPRYLVLAHVGINNQSVFQGGASGSTGTGGYGVGKKPGIFYHDVWNEFAVLPTVDPKSKQPNDFSLYVGAGLHYWNGISRMTSASTLNFMAIDAPVINWPLVDVSDQFVRQYGIYAKGAWDKLQYRFALNKPFQTNQTPVFDPLVGELAVDNNGDPKPAIQGYLDYQFFEKEANVLPFRVGSYVGTKRVFNVGGGFFHQKDGTKSLDATGVTHSHPIQLLGLDVFADLPFGNRGMAFTGYSVFYRYQFGPNYIRKMGIMNPAGGVDPSFDPENLPLNGPGNSRFFVGSGEMWYSQAGLLMPKAWSNKMRIQPFVAHTYKNLEYLGQGGHYWDCGTNFYIDGHNAKITAQYSTHPLYYQRAGHIQQDGHRGELMVQFHIYI
jgi:hypothetical protein